MAIAKKGTRLITVDGVEYRWVVQPDEKYRLGIVVEWANNPGQRMVTWVDPDNIASAWLVKEAIHYALGQGWQPQHTGKELVFNVYGYLQNPQDWSKASKGRHTDQVCFDDWNPSPGTLRRWAYDENLLLDEQDEDLVLHSPEYLPILIPLADEPLCPKADYILSCLDFYLMFLALGDQDWQLEVINDAIAIAETTKRTELADWVALLKRRLAYRAGIGPVNRAIALTMGQDLLNGICRQSDITLSSETEATFEVQLSVPPFHRHKEWLTIDKATGQFSFRR